jgi:hypothetical protein
MPLLPFVLAGLVGVGAVLFLVAGRRRRRHDPDAPGTSPAPGRPSPVGALGVALAMAAATAPATDAALATADALVADPIEPDESKMPRWRRPSLMQARRADVRLTDKREPIRFGDAGVDTADLRLVRYDLARVTDGPSEVGTTELGLLGRGDEVLVLDRQGTYVRVRTPDGLEGWVHRTILSQFEAPAAPAGASGLAPEQPMPEAPIDPAPPATAPTAHKAGSSRKRSPKRSNGHASVASAVPASPMPSSPAPFIQRLQELPPAESA